MFGKFHDEDYDGVVIKLPSWFIKMNELEKDLDNLKKALGGCKMSIYYSDHLNNMHELDNINDKSVILKKKKDEENKRQKYREEIKQKILSGEIYKVYWKKHTSSLNFEFVRVVENGIKVSINQEEYKTPKQNVKAEFVKRITPLISDYSSLLNFAQSNCSQLFFDMDLCPPEFIDLNVRFYIDAYLNLSISWNSLYVETEVTQSKTGLSFYPAKLIQFKDGCLGLKRGGSINDYPRLEGYKLKNQYLVKQD